MLTSCSALWMPDLVSVGCCSDSGPWSSGYRGFETPYQVPSPPMRCNCWTDSAPAMCPDLVGMKIINIVWCSTYSDLIYDKSLNPLKKFLMSRRPFSQCIYDIFADFSPFSGQYSAFAAYNHGLLQHTWMISFVPKINGHCIDPSEFFCDSSFDWEKVPLCLKTWMEPFKSQYHHSIKKKQFNLILDHY